MSCKAVEKADALVAFAKRRGSPLKDFQVTITLEEAWELLDFMAAGGLGFFQNHHVLVTDVAAAKAAGDPWTILPHMQLCGMPLARADRVLN
jgi:hypothetical protein